MKKFILILIMLLISWMPVNAKDAVSAVADMSSEFSIEQNVNNVSFTPQSDINIDKETIIPAKSYVTPEATTSRIEKRFHKSGFFVCHIVNYKPENSTETIDISSKDYYMIGKKYIKVDGVDATITGAEFTTTTLAGILVPGCDILYYFTKGAIKRERDPNWFKSGVSNAYDNSILWIFEKGRPITLKRGDTVAL